MLGGLQGLGARGGLAGVDGGGALAGAARSVLGRSAATSGALADIVATADNTFLGRVGGVLAFTAVTVGVSSNHIARGSGTGELTGSGELTYDATTKRLEVVGTLAGTHALMGYFKNDSATAGAGTRIKVDVAAGGTGDALYTANVSGGAAWTWGIDNSAGDQFCLNPSDGTVGAGDVIQVSTAGNFAIGAAAVATSATDGFLYVTTCAGTPTGAPTAITGRAAVVVDSTNHKLNFYSGGAWRNVGPGSDVIDRQTLGSAAQEITFVVDGNADEVIEFEGVGSVLTGNLTLKFNDDATPATYRGIYSEDGGAAPESTYLGTYLGAVGGFTIKVFAKTGSRRGGFGRTWSERASDGLQQQVLSVFRWANDTDNITSIKLRMSAAGGFPAGLIVIARRRKITA